MVIGSFSLMASITLLAAAGDLRMLVRGGLFGAKRIARHLWRMCFGLFIASGSFFFGPSNRPLRLLSRVGRLRLGAVSHARSASLAAAGCRRVRRFWSEANDYLSQVFELPALLSADE
jgi:hypothetical protein